ncbi:MAG: HAMP domain-containing protein [Clostridia bacterium]|nr:HAMP domain-containing protein [Clostridia bacterium]
MADSKAPAIGENTRPLVKSAHNKRRKLQTRLILFCTLFALLLATFIGGYGYYVHTTSMMERYYVYAETQLYQALSWLNGDELALSIATGEMSEAYYNQKAALDLFLEYSEIRSLYVVYFPDPADFQTMYYVISATSSDILAEDPDFFTAVNTPGVIGDAADADYDLETASLIASSMQDQPETATVQFIANDTELYGYVLTAYVPVFDSDSQVVSILALDLSMEEIRETMRGYLISVALGTILILAVFLLGFIYFLNRFVISPIRNLSHSARDFVAQSDRAQDDPTQLLFKPVPVHTKDEIELLSESISDMTSGLKSYMINLKTITGEKERISAELNVAREIQASMLPQVFPAVHEYEIQASMLPAKEVGGDFYDFFQPDADHLCVVVADVSGKGVPAALFMAIAKALIKQNVLSGKSPAEVFTVTNEQLCEGNGGNLFVTAWMGLLELSTGKLTYVNAGHNPPLLKTGGSAFTYLKSIPGFVLAGMEGIVYRQSEILLGAGDVLYLYTDGVTEATNADNELYGDDRLITLANQVAVTALDGFLKRIQIDIDAFVQEAPQADDITMLALKIKARR